MKNLNSKTKMNCRRFKNKSLIKASNSKKIKNLKRLSNKISLRKNLKIKNLITRKNHKLKTLKTPNQTEKILSIHKNNKNSTESNISTKTNQSKSNELNSKRLEEIKSNTKKNKRKNNSKTTKIIMLKMDKNYNVKKAILDTILVKRWHIHLGKPNNNSNNKSLSNLSKARKYYSDLLYLLKLVILVNNFMTE